MKTISLNSIDGEMFDSGRNTKVVVGGESPVQAANFVSGYVVIKPDGKVPIHRHENEEVYYILKGIGEMRVGNETNILEAKSAVYIPSQQEHALTNIGQDELHMLFIYSPAGTVSHWEEERLGKLK